MNDDSDSDITVPYNEEEGKGEATTNGIREVLNIASLDQQQTASIVASLLPLCQKVMAADCMAKTNTECVIEKDNDKNNKNSSKSNKDKISICDPRTNVEVGCENNDSSRSNDITIELSIIF